MAKSLRAILFLLLAATLAPAVHAESVTFTGVNGQHSGGFYVSPYYGTINGQPVTLYCVDFRNNVSIGQTWEANISTITLADLVNVRYGGLPNALELYAQAAWLVSQFATNPGEWADLQYALWNLFTPSAPDTAGATGSNYWLQQAALNWGSVNLSEYRVVTNIQPVTLTGQVQEFIIHVPEPGSMLLLGAGLAAIAAVRRRTAKFAA